MARKKTVAISRKPSVSAPPAPAEAAAANPEANAAPEASRPPAGAASRHDDAPRREARPPEPAIAGPLGRMVYGTVFSLSYGVVYGVILIGQLIPGGRLIGRGLRDGATAARRDFDQRAAVAAALAEASLPA